MVILNPKERQRTAGFELVSLGARESRQESRETAGDNDGSSKMASDHFLCCQQYALPGSAIREQRVPVFVVAAHCWRTDEAVGAGADFVPDVVTLETGGDAAEVAAAGAGMFDGAEASHGGDDSLPAMQRQCGWKYRCFASAVEKTCIAASRSHGQFLRW